MRLLHIHDGVIGEVQSWWTQDAGHMIDSPAFVVVWESLIFLVESSNLLHLLPFARDFP